MQIGPTASSQEQAVAGNNDAVAKEGQVSGGVTRCPNGFEGQVANVEGRGHMGCAVERSGVRPLPTSLRFCFMHDDFESLSTSLKGFFDTVPRELEEAALMDGCSQTQVFWKIVLPLSLPAVAVTALFSFLAAWNEFLLALTFNTSESMYTLPVGLASLISSTGQAWGDFAAASLLVSLPVVVLFIVFQRFLIEGLSAGGVKG